MLRPFEIHQPETVAAASRLLGHYGDDAAFYAGGTELLLVMKAGLVRYRHLIDLKTIRQMDAITYDPHRGVLEIGGTATHRAVERHPAVRGHFPVLAEMERQVANVRVRNVGTIGGNLCFAEPHADPGTLLLTFEGEVELQAATGGRTVPIGVFFLGAYETARRPDEVLTSIRLRHPGEHTRHVYLKFGVHERPTLGVALALTLDPSHEAVQDVRIAVGCVNPAPVRIPAAEEMLQNRSLHEARQRLNDAAQAAARSVDAVDDLHGSAEYKTEMVKVFVRRAFRAAVARFDGTTAPP